MSEQNLSQWFDLTEQKPWEVGVYEFKAIDRWGDPLKRPYYSWWDGKEFHGGWDDPVMAYENKSYTELGFYSATHWRGLSTNPEVKKKHGGNKKVTRHIVYMKIDGCALMSKIFGIYESLAEAKKKQAMHRRSSLKTIRFRTPE